LEQPFVVNGRRWLYCYQPSTGRHCYLDLDCDIATWHRSFHPSFSPQFERMEEETGRTPEDPGDAVTTPKVRPPAHQQSEYDLDLYF